MKKRVLIGSLAVMLGLAGCAGFGNSTALAGLRIANDKLETEDSPVRYEGTESEYGVSYHPRLIGQVAPSVAASTLKTDTLQLIMQKEDTREIELLQTRFVNRNPDPLTYKEVWVIKRGDNQLHAHTILFAQSPQGGTDIQLTGAANVFVEMLKQ